MSPKKVTPVKKQVGKSARNTKHVYKDKYESEANSTRADRLKLISNLPSSQGLPDFQPKKTAAKKKGPIVQNTVDEQAV